MATTLHFDGREEEIRPANGTDFRLDELKPIVGEGAPAGDDYIEIYPLKDGRIIVLNEEGKLLGLARNEKATILADFPSPEQRKQVKANYAAAGIPLIMAGFDDDQPDYIAGTVLVCKNSEVR